MIKDPEIKALYRAANSEKIFWTGITLTILRMALLGWSLDVGYKSSKVASTDYFTGLLI